MNEWLKGGMNDRKLHENTINYNVYNYIFYIPWHMDTKLKKTIASNLWLSSTGLLAKNSIWPTPMNISCYWTMCYTTFLMLLWRMIPLPISISCFKVIYRIKGQIYGKTLKCLLGWFFIASWGIFMTSGGWSFLVCSFSAARGIFQLSGDCPYYRWQGFTLRPMLTIYGF
jgi:hypothetical protein